MKRAAFFIGLFLLSISLLAQDKGVIKGKITDVTNNTSLPFVTVGIQELGMGATTDNAGNYQLSGLSPGVYNLTATFLGYKTKTIYEIEVTNARPAIVNIGLEEETRNLETVEISADESFYKPEESPVSLRTIGQNEIKRFPGANRDISRVLRALPGVATVPSFRNDLIIRGGAPNENRYYLDGIEVPNINHFATQGASGGPVGLINVDLIEEVEFYSGAFPANRGNALSSILEFTQKDGRTDKTALNFIVSATDIGATFDSPITEKSSLILSVRRSYLQFLFDVLELPFLPTYNDYQLKYKYKFNDKNQLSIISLGALDQFSLNLDANDTPDQRYLLNNLPVNAQWNYAVGAKFEHFRDNGFYTFVVSRNMLNNEAFKYPNNDESQPRNLDYLSQEIENKIRIENQVFEKNGWIINYGINYEFAEYYNRTFNTVSLPEGQLINNFESAFTLNRWGDFGQVSKRFVEDRLGLSLGIRTDANDYSEAMDNLLDQFSPRFSASYSFTPVFSWNFNVGRFYQLPPYTVLGYKNNEGQFINRVNGVTYIQSDHLVTGFEYRLPQRNARITVEGFYKWYDNYPFAVGDSISLANLGSDFGVIGNEEVVSTSQGRAYGVEFLYQQKLFEGVYGLLAYTFVRSEFQDRNGSFVPSSWDNRHIVSLTAGKRWGKNWELSGRFLFSGGAPFTPFDIDRTVRQENWDILGQGIPDFNRLNQERTSVFHQLDVRVDKKWFFERWSLNLFLDIQNIYGFETQLQDNVDVVRDESGMPVTDPNNPEAYLPQFLSNTNGTVLPSIGIIVEL
ncbi:MAG: TonB-dependent receptor domain-containing protein [Thermonemataceae bacterium]